MDSLTTASPGNSTGAETPSVPLVRSIADLPGPKGVPVLGNMLQIDSLRFHRVLEDWAREFGTMYKIRMGRKSAVVISDNALIANLLRDRPDALRRSSRTSRILTELGTSGVFTDEGRVAQATKIGDARPHAGSDTTVFSHHGRDDRALTVALA